MKWKLLLLLILAGQDMTSQWEKIKLFRQIMQWGQESKNCQSSRYWAEQVRIYISSRPETHLYSNPWFSKKSICIAKTKEEKKKNILDKTHSTFTEKNISKSCVLQVRQYTRTYESTWHSPWIPYWARAPRLAALRSCFGLLLDAQSIPRQNDEPHRTENNENISFIR